MNKPKNSTRCFEQPKSNIDVIKTGFTVKLLSLQFLEFVWFHTKRNSLIPIQYGTRFPVITLQICNCDSIENIDKVNKVAS